MDRKGHKWNQLDKGEYAATPQGMQHNYEVMRDAGYNKQRSEATAYGEVGEEKIARKHESYGMKKAMKQK
jgi:hypothetical protein